MNEIDILKILIIRLQNPDILIKQRTAQAISELIVDYHHNPELKTLFLDWLKQIHVETIALVGLGIIHLVNKRKKDFFSLSDIKNNLSAASILSAEYIKIIFNTSSSLPPKTYIHLPNYNLPLDRHGWNYLPLEGLVRKIDEEYIPDFFVHWNNELSQLGKMLPVEHIQRYNKNLGGFSFPITDAAASAFLRALNWAFYTKAASYGMILYWALWANPIDIDLLELRDDNAISEIEDKVLTDLQSIKNMDFVPVYLHFFKKIDENNFSEYQYFAFKYTNKDITIVELEQEIKLKVAQNRSALNLSSDILKGFPRADHILAVEAGLDGGFKQPFFNYDIYLPNAHALQYKDITVLRNKISFSTDKGEIGFLKYWHKTPGEYDIIPHGGTFSIGTFINKENIFQVGMKLGYFIVETKHTKAEHFGPYKVSNKSNKISYLE